jgi:hypothetical protein
MTSEDPLLLIGALPPSVAERFAARLAEAGVDAELKPADVGRGWEVQIYVRDSELERARAVQAAFIRESVPDLPADYDPHATVTTEGCPACGAEIAEGATECADCGLALPG